MMTPDARRSPARRPRPRAVRRRAPLVAIAMLALLALAACSGPDTGDDADATAVATATATTPPTVAVLASPTAAASPTTAPTATVAASPTRGASPTRAGSPAPGAGSPTSATQALKDQLPTLAELPGEGYKMTAEGTRTAQELANAYEDKTAHLQRLTEWGFKAHYYREFGRDTSGAGDPLPYDILATINVYGSPDQAQAALDWLKTLGTSTGGQLVTAPSIGDNAVALTVPTSDGTPTASIYVRTGDSVYVYFAEGGKPLDAVTGIAEKVFARIR